MAAFAIYYDEKEKEIQEAYLNRGEGYKKIVMGKARKDATGTSDTVSKCFLIQN